MKLISMTDFVLEQEDSYYNQRFFKIEKYAKFLKQPLELWMFVPCYFRDGIWISYAKDTLLNTIDLFNEWEQAKERCLFEGGKSGFRIHEHKVFAVDNNIFSEKDTVINLLEYVGREFTLTKTAEKLIGL